MVRGLLPRVSILNDLGDDKLDSSRYRGGFCRDIKDTPGS